MQETGTKSDRKGVIAGVGKQKRLWVDVSSEEASDDESAVVNEHEQQAKAKKTKMRPRLMRWRTSWMEASRWAKAMI